MDGKWEKSKFHKKCNYFWCLAREHEFSLQRWNFLRSIFRGTNIRKMEIWNFLNEIFKQQKNFMPRKLKKMWGRIDDAFLLQMYFERNKHSHYWVLEKKFLLEFRASISCQDFWSLFIIFQLPIKLNWSETKRTIMECWESFRARYGNFEHLGYFLFTNFTQ